MKIDQLRDHWERFGQRDPMWAILTRREAKGNRWDHDEFFRTGDEEIARVFTTLDELGATPHPGRALDFGCGVGRLSQALARRFERVDGVDIASSMLELARSLDRSDGRCRFHHNTVPDLSLFEADSFDFVYTNIVLQHIRPDYVRAYLAEFARVLKPGGVLVFQMTAGRVVTDADRSLPRRVEATWKRLTPYRLRHPFRRRPRMEVHCLPRDEVVSTLESCGAEFLKIEPDASAGPGFESYRYHARLVGQGAPAAEGAGS